MNGSVQVIDQRGADGRLRQDQFDGGERIARVAFEHPEECAIFSAGSASFVVGKPFAA